jgi:hypothetical protein
MKILLGMMMMVLGAVHVNAGTLSDEQYQVELKRSYEHLERKERQFQQAMHSSQHQLAVIEKACDYANTLKNLRSLTTTNRHLPAAKVELVMLTELNRNINYSFKVLGTSYSQSCQTV